MGSRTVAVPPGGRVRAADWHPDDPVELLGRPRIVARGDSAGIVYPVVVWRPGRQMVELPGPLLLGAGGAWIPCRVSWSSPAIAERAPAGPAPIRPSRPSRGRASSPRGGP